MRPEGQVTLCYERRSRIHTIDFLVVNIPDEKPVLLSGRDAQALNYLKVYADETANAVEEEILAQPATSSTTRKADEEQCTTMVLERIQSRALKPPRNPMHIELDPNVRPVHV